MKPRHRMDAHHLKCQLCELRPRVTSIAGVKLCTVCFEKALAIAGPRASGDSQRAAQDRHALTTLMTEQDNAEIISASYERPTI